MNYNQDRVCFDPRGTCWRKASFHLEYGMTWKTERIGDK